MGKRKPASSEGGSTKKPRISKKAVPGSGIPAASPTTSSTPSKNSKIDINNIKTIEGVSIDSSGGILAFSNDKQHILVNNLRTESILHIEIDSDRMFLGRPAMIGLTKSLSEVGVDTVYTDRLSRGLSCIAEVHRFNSVTQFVVLMKSLLFNPAGDDEIADTQKQEQMSIVPKLISQGSLFTILKSSDIIEIQSQGRKIPGFDKQIWSRAAPGIAAHAIAAKAELNPDMAKELLANHQCDWRAAGGPGNGRCPYRTDIAVIKLDYKTIEAMELAEVPADHARNIHAEIRPLKENKVYKLTIQYEKERVVTQNILVPMPHVFFQDLKSTLAAGQSWYCFIIEATPGHVKKQFDALDQKRKVHAAADPMKRWYPEGSRRFVPQKGMLLKADKRPDYSYQKKYSFSDINEYVIVNTMGLTEEEEYSAFTRTESECLTHKMKAVEIPGGSDRRHIIFLPLPTEEQTRLNEGDTFKMVFDISDMLAKVASPKKIVVHLFGPNAEVMIRDRVFLDDRRKENDRPDIEGYNADDLSALDLVVRRHFDESRANKFNH